jgi:hypothetical protein
MITVEARYRKRVYAFRIWIAHLCVAAAGCIIEVIPAFGVMWVSLLLLHYSFRTTARHVLEPDLGSRCVSEPGCVETCMHGNS